MLFHHPTMMMPTMPVHVCPAAWLKTVWLEVVVMRLTMVVAGVVNMGGLQPSFTSIRSPLAFTAILHFTVKRRQEVGGLDKNMKTDNFCK